MTALHPRDEAVLRLVAARTYLSYAIDGELPADEAIAFCRELFREAADRLLEEAA